MPAGPRSWLTLWLSRASTEVKLLWKFASCLWVALQTFRSYGKARSWGPHGPSTACILGYCKAHVPQDLEALFMVTTREDVDQSSSNAKPLLEAPEGTRQPL